jgi:hypothetical protein
MSRRAFNLVAAAPTVPRIVSITAKHTTSHQQLDFGSDLN